MKGRPGLMMTAIPAILTAAAVYISLAYAVKLTATVFDKEEANDYIRADIGVTHQKPYVEQTPPPSPEAVIAAFQREVTGEANAPDDRRPIILEPDLEGDSATVRPDQLSVSPIELGPLPNPLNTYNAGTEAAPFGSE